MRCLEANRHNHITATYHLINRKNQRNTYMRETFSTHRAKDENASKRERLQSQGAAVKTTGIVLDNVKPNPRKANPDELNQTMQVAPDKKFVEQIELPPSQNKKREAGSEVPQTRRDPATIEFTHAEQNLNNVNNTEERARFANNAPSPIVPSTTTSTRADRVKGEIIRSRITKQSQSPDKYHLNNNLIVQLADPIKKPVDLKAKLYST